MWLVNYEECWPISHPWPELSLAAPGLKMRSRAERTRDVPTTEEEDTWARVLCGPGHSDLQLRASWQIFSQLRSDRRAEESWYQGEVFSVIQSPVNPITTSTNPQLTISVKKQKLHTAVSLLLGQRFIVSNLVSNSICMELISIILASGILYWELINSNSYLGHTHT